MDFNEVVLIVCLALFEMLVGIKIGRNIEKAVDTPSTSNNSAMLEIALILREFVADSSEHGITDTKYYHQKIDAVVAQLQQ